MQYTPRQYIDMAIAIGSTLDLSNATQAELDALAREHARQTTEENARVAALPRQVVELSQWANRAKVCGYCDKAYANWRRHKRICPHIYRRPRKYEVPVR